MDECRRMNSDPNNVLQKSVSEVYKRVAYEIRDSVTVQPVSYTHLDVYKRQLYLNV